METKSLEINMKGATWTLGIAVTTIIACLFYFASQKKEHVIQKIDTPIKVAALVVD